MRRHEVRRGRVAGWAVLVLALCANVALAGQPRVHDGFFLRLSAGGGPANAKIETQTGSVEFSGGAMDFNMAIGGRVQENLIMHGTLFGWTLENPRGDVAIPGVPVYSGSPEGTLDLAAFGGGLTYYFMPANIFLTGSVGSGWLEGSGDLEGESESGFAAEAGIGKEWWVADSWGLGGTFAVSYFSMKDKSFLGAPDNWSGFGYTLRFTATLN